LSHFPTLHLTSSIINYRHSRFSSSFFSIFHVILPSFHVKNGSFQPIKSLRVPYLHQAPRLPYFFIITDNLPS
jgi:hypothetical protein